MLIVDDNEMNRDMLARRLARKGYDIRVTESARDLLERVKQDAIDLLVTCVEAGLGLDQAMRKVSEEMKRTFRVISEEFSLCNFQLQVGRPRNEVLHELGAPLAVQKELLRHSDIQTTMNIYTQAVSATKRQAAEKVQSILLGKKGA